ncbi:hypothetical protein CVD28_04375 [Bacillus sp. M6-12]|uniref:hypothetical protein n=1 Tax=Bacillus sp. M6-12 TaxID=2054166 RepID=UPI000C77E5AA|nr:hypothetical protein [Bacillus sp. M6-12]PLS19658.1 hypothetical protein CVD28_04375 [Bacillus sp. M6-12]
MIIQERKDYQKDEHLMNKFNVLNEYAYFKKTGKYCNSEGERVKVHGYSAEQLVNELGLKPIFAYNCLVSLIDEPSQTLFLLRQKDGVLIKEELIEHFMDTLKMSHKQSTQYYQRLATHRDILMEYHHFMKTGQYCNEKEVSIQVGEYTAKRLMAETNLEPIGAYNYLISLREKPEWALKQLKRGLPVK